MLLAFDAILAALFATRSYPTVGAGIVLIGTVAIGFVCLSWGREET
jgi:hypothetical protein